MEIGAEELLFFNEHPAAWPLYLCLREKLLTLDAAAAIGVRKTQISFQNPRLFAAVSFLPVRPAARRPKDYITVTFGLGHPLTSSRIDAMCEPYPNRWTHHVLIGAAEEIDDQLMVWLAGAHAFARQKKR